MLSRKRYLEKNLGALVGVDESRGILARKKNGDYGVFMYRDNGDGSGSIWSAGGRVSCLEDVKSKKDIRIIKKNFCNPDEARL